MAGADSGTRDHQVAGTDRTEHAFAGNREPGLGGKMIAAGKNHQFTDGSCAGQGTEKLLPGTPVRCQPSQRRNQNDNGQNNKKPA